MSFRLAAYAVCIEHASVLLVRCTPPPGESVWSLPGGKVEHGEDPYETVSREVAEETGLAVAVEQLLGVDSRLIPAHESYGGAEHQNVGIFYAVRVVGGDLRSELDGTTVEAAWRPLGDIGGLCRSSLVDVGLALARERPSTGHVATVPVGGLVRH
ncbi:MAG: NUDIX hydrolase [Ilumatobacteraceae bacterium]